MANTARFYRVNPSAPSGHLPLHKGGLGRSRASEANKVKSQNFDVTTYYSYYNKEKTTEFLRWFQTVEKVQFYWAFSAFCGIME